MSGQQIAAGIVTVLIMLLIASPVVLLHYSDRRRWEKWRRDNGYGQ